MGGFEKDGQPVRAMLLKAEQPVKQTPPWPSLSARATLICSSTPCLIISARISSINEKDVSERGSYACMAIET